MDEEKAIGLLRLRLNGVMSPFDAYGMGIQIPEAIAQIVKLAEQFCEDMKGAKG